jgi:hypothetical protein
LEFFDWTLAVRESAEEDFRVEDAEAILVDDPFAEFFREIGRDALDLVGVAGFID